jgi:hypothetical protein
MKRLVLCLLALPLFAAAPKTPPTQVFNTPTTVRWGSYVWPPYPAKPPKLVEFDLAGRSKLFLGWKRAVATKSPAGSYKFEPQDGTRQVIWIADSLLKKPTSFTVSGLSWVINPDDNTPQQSLTIMGVPGKVFMSANVNNGSYTVRVTQ